MNRKRLLAGALSLSVGLVGCNTPQTGTPSSQVEVEPSFRERLALAPGVRLEASLLDIASVQVLLKRVGGG